MSLDWLTPEALDRAWEHVRENGGCAGADGVTIDHFARDLDAELGALQHAVEADEYASLPLLPITVQKKPDSDATRTLMVPAVRDRVLQTVVGRHLGHAFEDEFLECSFAYRPKRSVNSAIGRIRYLHDHGYRYISEADIESFFDRIDHALLRKRMAAAVSDPVILTLLEHWLAGPVWDGHSVEPLRQGVPQGSPISPLLANLFLSDFDLALERTDLKVIRYADDFLILSKDAEHATQALAIARDELEALHLKLKDEKTKISSFEEGFQFLGAFFRGAGIWIPWEKHGKSRRVLAMPRPMPPSLVRRWLEPPNRTAMQRAFSAAGLEHFNLAGSKADEEGDVAYLYLMEQGSVLRKIGNRLVVEKDGAILRDMPYHKLEVVTLFGNVQVTTQAMSELLDAGIRLNLMSRHGELRGSLESPLGKNVPLRIAQFELHRDADRSLAMARTIVEAKIANSAAVLATFGDRDLLHGPTTAAALSQLDDFRKAACKAATLEVLNGGEGASARLYFNVLMERNKSKFQWPGRIKHPATDPLNSLLSFAYTLVTNELAGLAEAAGLDSYLGSLHELDYGRRSLALDLVELFRAPLADRLVLTMCNRRQFDEASFEPGEGGALYLRPEPSKHFFAEYERWMLHMPAGPRLEGFRQALRKTVEEYAAAVRENRVFVPYLYRDTAETEKAAGKANAP